MKFSRTPKILFRPVYLAIIFLIRIGEITEKLLFSPLTLVKLIFPKRQPHKNIPKHNHTILSESHTRQTASKKSVRIPRMAAVVARITLEILGRLAFYLRVILWLVGRILYYLIIYPLKMIPLGYKFFIFGFVTCAVIVLYSQIKNYISSLPSPYSIGKVNYSLSSYLYDRNGRLLYEFYREQNRTPVRLIDLPDYVYQATIAIEDKDFYRHSGVSVVNGILRAARDSYLTKKLQGGSTITQQLVKSALLSPERTMDRKMKEILVAIWTERIYSKDKILEMYMNQVPYGGEAYGIEEAAKNYFGKSSRDLTISEAAFLAGLPQAPSAYSPYANYDLAIKRRNEVIKKMYELKYINQQARDDALAEELTVREPYQAIKAPHFVFYTKSELERMYGPRMTEEGGIRAVTSLDLDIQAKAEKILKEELDKIKNLNVTNGAILITRPTTGEILAMVGSVDYYAQPSGSFNVTTAIRQPGSSIKPLMYSLALERGYTSVSQLDDAPVTFATANGTPYSPVNYDGGFHGRVTIRQSLANSYNIPAVKLLNNLGVMDFVEHSRRMGITTWTRPERFGLSLTLGGGEVMMTDMSTAYGIFANNGYRVEVNPILKLSLDSGEELQDFKPQKVKVLSDATAYIISDIMSDNIARRQAFGPNSALEIPGYKVAVKTGTTDSKKDNWTIGYTPEFLVSVWVGNNDNTPMNPALTSGVTGAAPIWHRVMEMLLKDYGSSKKWFDKPASVTEKKCYGRIDYFVKGTEKAWCPTEGMYSVTPTPAISTQPR